MDHACIVEKCFVGAAHAGELVSETQERKWEVGEWNSMLYAKMM